MIFEALEGPLIASVLRDIADRAAVKRYRTRAILAHDCDDSDGIFILLSGRVKVCRPNMAGERAICHEHGSRHDIEGRVPHLLLSCGARNTLADP
jgi:CRP-like cAMP-binding protein